MTVIALRRTDPPEAGAENGRAEGAIRAIAERFGRLGAEITDISGCVGDVTAQLDEQAGGLKRTLAAMGEVARANEAIRVAAGEAQGTAGSVEAGLERVSGAVKAGLGAAQGDIAALSEGARALSVALDEAVRRAQKVRAASDAIQSIAREIQLLSVNAGVEAARSGVAGRGFAVIAAAVKQLAEQTRAATVESARQLDALVGSVDELARRSRDNAEVAQRASEESKGISARVDELDAFGGSVRRLIDAMARIGEPTRANAAAFGRVAQDMTLLVKGIETSTASLDQASRRAGSLIETSEAILGTIAASGVRTAQSELIETCIATADAVAAVFGAALERGQVTLADLFDEQYRPIPGSDPPQFTTRFLALTDRELPAIQERLLGANKRIVFCAAVDRNGYLPTHNRKYSQAQGRDPVWNAANCRNRRIFDDRTGLAAARNRKPFLLQTYRRDLGGGQFVVMEDLSAPVMVAGRHWGGFRIGMTV